MCLVVDGETSKSDCIFDKLCLELYNLTEFLCAHVRGLTSAVVSSVLQVRLCFIKGSCLLQCFSLVLNTCGVLLRRVSLLIPMSSV